jgi:ankyrin repeat protein
MKRPERRSNAKAAIILAFALAESAAAEQGSGLGADEIQSRGIYERSGWPQFDVANRLHPVPFFPRGMTKPARKRSFDRKPDYWLKMCNGVFAMIPAAACVFLISITLVPALAGAQAGFTGPTPLERAVTQGDLNAVDQMIQAGADVNQGDRFGRTPLEWASQQGRLEIVRALLRAGADPDVKDQLGWTPLSLAFEFRHYEVMEALVEAGAHVDREQLKKDVNKSGAFAEPPLARARDLGSIRALIRLGADPNTLINGRTVLTSAAFSGDLGRVRALIEAGADVNAKDTRGWTSLLLASQMGHDAVVQALLNAGADVNAEGPGGRTALMQASYFNRIETAGVLIPASNVNYRNKEGITALMLAKWGCHAEMVDALTRAGSVTGREEWMRAPAFADFPVARVYKGVPAPVDLRSNPAAPNFRTRLREGARKGPNFADHFTVVSWGCGSNCESNMIVDALTGRVYDGFGDERGAEFKMNSRLVIADPASPGTKAYEGDPTWGLPVRYYVWEGRSFRLIYEEACAAVDGYQKCGCGNK